MIQVDNLVDVFHLSSKISIYYDNKQILIDNNEHKLIIDTLIEITANSHEMPAFGVSIDSETRVAMENGLWLELQFNNTIVHSDMPFNALLINVDSTFSGFNLIRKYNNLYEGRCYYLQLESTMKPLHDVIMEIRNKKELI